jgi:glycosyltransferase involved in cell wall biosynthesis
VNLSVVIITFNEEANLPRTLASVQALVENTQGEIIVVDSGSTDRTVEIAKGFGAKVFVEAWKGFAAQKNSAIDKATGAWILSLDADEEVSPSLAEEVAAVLKAPSNPGGYLIPRQNFFLGRWIKHGGFWPDPKLRLFLKGAARFEERAVHEDAKPVEGIPGQLTHALLHHAYPTLSDYIEHMNRYSTLGAEMAVAKGYRGFSVIDVLVRPIATFIYNYIFRLGFLDGREGLLLHLYHSVYVSWKYAKAWELNRRPE